MGLPKHRTNNPNGRPKGSRNRINEQLRTRIHNFLSENWSTIVEDFKSLEPQQRVMLFEKLLKYSVPELRSIDMTMDFDKLDESTLDTIIENLYAKIKKDG